jgi:hypothetical protein
MKNLIKVLVVSAGLVGTGSIASAAICAQVTGVNLTTSPVAVPEIGAGCVVSGFDFSNFFIANVNGVTANNFSFAVNTTNIGLTFGYSNVPGLDFSLWYTVNPGVHSMILSTNTATGITETMCTVAYNPQTQNCVGAGGTAAFNNPPVSAVTAPATITLPGAQTATFVFKDINGGSDFMQVVVPEPVSISIVGLGLLGLGLIGRRRVRK